MFFLNNFTMFVLDASKKNGMRMAKQKAAIFVCFGKNHQMYGKLLKAQLHIAADQLIFHIIEKGG